MADLAELRSRVKDRFGDTDADIFSNAEYDDRINEAYEHFLSFAHWPFLITNTDKNVTANQNLISLTDAEAQGLHSVFDVTEDRKLRFITPEVPFKMRVYWEEIASEPIWYEVVGNNLFILPAARTATTIRVFFFSYPALLTTDTDVPVVPTRFQQALVSGALAKLYTDDHSPDMAQTYWQEFDRIVQQAVQELASGLAITSETLGERQAEGQTFAPGSGRGQ